MLGYHVFQGTNAKEVLVKIQRFDVIKALDKTKLSSFGKDLLVRMLAPAENRIRASAALSHPYFAGRCSISLSENSRI